jgi:plasmid maintenance system antidote protein VapI
MAYEPEFVHVVRKLRAMIPSITHEQFLKLEKYLPDLVEDDALQLAGVLMGATKHQFPMAQKLIPNLTTRRFGTLKRIFGGMKVESFAELIGVKWRNIQEIEAGNLKLSEDTAQRIFWATGADPDHLRQTSEEIAQLKRDTPKALRGKVFTPKFALNNLPYRADSYQMYRSKVRIPADKLPTLLEEVAYSLNLLVHAASRADEAQKDYFGGTNTHSVFISFLQWLNKTKNGMKLSEFVAQELTARGTLPSSSSFIMQPSESLEFKKPKNGPYVVTDSGSGLPPMYTKLDPDTAWLFHRSPHT